MERPDHIPAAATFDPSDAEWMFAERDEEGREHGTVTWWRADGSRCCVTEYVHGTPHGRFERFHDNGETSRTGAFEGGQLHGLGVFFRSTEPTSEVFPAGLADGVWRCEMDYAMGRIGEARAYDRQGVRVLEDGSPYPESQPEGVPSSAHFRKEDDEWRWVDGTVVDEGDGTVARTGTWRWWSPDGVLRLERGYEDGQPHGIERSFDEAGTLVATVTYDEGDLSGPFERRAEPGRYRVAAHTEVGTFDDGELVGTLALRGADGALLAEVHLGDACSQDQLLEAMQLGDADGDLSILDEAPAAGFLAAVHRRVAAEELTRRLVALQPPLSPQAMGEATQHAQHVVGNVMRFGGGPVAVVSTLVGGIRRGGDAGDLLRHGAAVLDDMGYGPIAAKWIDAACAIDADFVGHEYTRALIRMSMGEPDEAMASIERLATGMEGAAAQLRAYHAGLFRCTALSVDDDPRLALAQRLAPMLTPSVLADVPELDVVRRTLRQIAARVEAEREGLQHYYDEMPAFAPPSLSHLLGDDEVEVELPDASNIGWMHDARKDLLRFRWLCWSLGIDGRSLPEAVTLPDDRPSRALMLVVVGRALALNGQAPDVSDWLDADHEDVAAIQSVIDQGMQEQTWYGMRLAELDGGPKNFAFQDEHALFELMYRHWGESHTVFEA